jgi:hypothetical protein
VQIYQERLIPCDVRDGGREADSKPIQDAPAGVLAIELPLESNIEERMEKTESSIEQLIGYFEERGYEVAATNM